MHAATELFIVKGNAMDRFFPVRKETQILHPEQVERMVAAHKRIVSQRKSVARRPAREGWSALEKRIGVPA